MLALVHTFQEIYRICMVHKQTQSKRVTFGNLVLYSLYLMFHSKQKISSFESDKF